ncbi:MAG: FtsX-like permease family protein [Bacteroidota bacterium]
MNLEYFIVQKVTESNKKSFSRLIIRIATASIALCLAVMIGATAMISGFKKEISGKIFDFNGHIQITALGLNSGNLAAETAPVNKDQKFYKELANVQELTYQAKREIFGIELPGYYDVTTKGGVKHIQVYAIKPGVLKTKKQIEGILLKGVGDDYDWTFMRQFLVAGEVLPLKSEEEQRGIFISEYTANRLEVEVGSKFTVYFVKGQEQIRRRLTVQGIFKTGMSEFDRGFALVDIRFLQALNGWSPNEVGGFEVFLDDLDDLEVMTEYIDQEEVPSHLLAANLKKIVPGLFGWLDFQDINEVVILTMMIAVCIINMITALLILILERTNMIGILKAMGATNWSIRKIFLYHAAYIIGLGLIWGNIVGIGFCLLEDHFHFIKLSEENYYLSYAPIDLKIGTILALNVGTLILTVTFLIIPTYLITKISPVKAIRFN